jgi:polyisoprenyl-teichoic acid--peptidoglycan teichoic acid transferase
MTILLLGNDSEWVRGGRTDTMIIVAINRETKTAAMLSLPRDLFVYIPGWTMAKLNTAVPHGYSVNYPGGGVELLKETILYNFGIPIDYYARIGFNSFKQIVDALGGIEVVVSCPLTDWRLKAPELDPNLVENWEQFTLELGVHQMDGDLALWYVRSRQSSNDFERSRRQQQLLRAILDRGVELDLLTQLPALWDTYQENVQTDISLATILQLAALAPEVRDNGIQHLQLTYGALQPWSEPETGQSVQLLQWPEAERVLQQLFLPPVLNRSARPPIYVEVVSYYRLDYRLAADNLAWYGFIPVRTPADSQPAHTTITYYGDNFKGSYDWLLSWLFRRDTANIHLVSGESYPYDYRVTLGADYIACRPYLSNPPTP